MQPQKESPSTLIEDNQLFFFRVKTNARFLFDFTSIQTQTYFLFVHHEIFHSYSVSAKSIRLPLEKPIVQGPLFYNGFRNSISLALISSTSQLTPCNQPPAIYVILHPFPTLADYLFAPDKRRLSSVAILPTTMDFDSQISLAHIEYDFT